MTREEGQGEEEEDGEGEAVAGRDEGDGGDDGLGGDGPEEALHLEREAPEGQDDHAQPEAPHVPPTNI